MTDTVTRVTKSGAVTRRPASARPGRANIITNAILIVGAAITSLPFIWMIFGAFKPSSEAMATPPSLIPNEPTVEFIRHLFVNLNFGRFLGNTLVVVAVGYVGLVFMAMAGYAFAKFRFRGKGVMFGMVLSTMMIPIQVTLIPTFLILHWVGLTSTLVGIALPTLVSAFGIFLFRQFMTTLPDETLEAARLDGASELRVFWSIVLPMCKPILAVQAVLTFIAGWNSFLWPLVLAGTQRNYTLSVGVALLNQQIATNPSLQMAGAAVMVVPILVVFAIFQRHIVQGFSMSGLK